MDYDEVANLSSSLFEKDDDVTPEESKLLVTQEILFTILVVVGIVADTAIVHTIFRFERMNSVPHMFLANWAIADMLSLIVTPSSYRIISIIEERPLSQELMCVLLQGDLIFHHTAIIFMILLCLDWCLAAYFPRLTDKFRSIYKFIIGASWIFSLFIVSGLIRLCIKRIYYQITMFLIFFDYCTILLFVTGLQISRLVRKCKKNPINQPTLMLTLATVYTACWFMGFQLFFFIEYEQAHPGVIILVESCIFCSAIVNFTLLYRSSKDFQACFLQILKLPENRYANTLPDCETNSVDRSNDHIALENPTQDPPASTL